MSVKPALADLEFLAGTWRMELSRASFLPDPQAAAESSVTFGWIEDQGALAMRQGGNATWIIGRDDAESDYCVLYSDQRGVSRIYRMSLADGIWRLWRNTPGFSQRFEARISADLVTMDGRWEKSSDGGVTWEHDFNLKYLREPAG